MPDQLSPEPRPEPVQQDIEQVVQEFERQRTYPESQGMSERDLLKKSVQSLASQASPLVQTTDGQASSSGLLPDYASDAPAETKLEVEHLVELALKHGFRKANSEAAKSNPYVLDAFHDALAGKLYKEFKERGIIK